LKEKGNKEKTELGIFSFAYSIHIEVVQPNWHLGNL